MAIYLRQICLVAEKLNSAIDTLSQCFAIPPCYVDPAVGKFGLENTLLAVGSQFIEVVAPTQTGTAAGRFIERRKGDGGYMVICQVSDLTEQATLRQRARERDVRIAYEADHGSWNIMQLHPADMGAAFFEVDWDEEADPRGNWHAAGGKDWMTLASSEVIDAITAVELQSDDPEALAQHWAAIAGVDVTHKNQIPTVPLANAELHFVTDRDGRGPGLSGLSVRVVDRERLLAQAHSLGVTVKDNQLTICGTRFQLADADS